MTYAKPRIERRPVRGLMLECSGPQLPIECLDITQL
jgi:hypothetical protein